MSDDDNEEVVEPGREVETFYAGDCAVCSQEVEWLRKADRDGRIQFVDIAAPGFDAGRDAGMPIERSKDCLQARLPSGEVLEGVEAVRHLYDVTSSERGERVVRASMMTPVLDLGHRLVAERRLQRACERIAGSCASARKAG